MSTVEIILLTVFISLLPISQTSQAAKVVEFGPRLPEFIKQYPDKSWLIKFYDPRCYYCQQLEPTYINVAEQISHKYNNLIVGKVDCTQNFPTCSQYEISSYPTILLINQDNNITYNGARSSKALVSFTDRFLGPDVIEVRDCGHLQEVVQDNGVIVLSTFRNNSRDNVIAKAFKSLSRLHKTSWWFYRIQTSCRNLISNDAIYIVKLHQDKPIKFKLKKQGLDNDDEETAKNAMFKWLGRESFPVYAPITRRNYEFILQTKKLIIIAVLDEYKPAKRFSQPSSKFNHEFKEFAIKFNQHHGKDLLFGWSADLDLVESIVIGEVPVPNVMLLREDLSYKLLIEDFDTTKNQTDLLSRLSLTSVRGFIEAAKENKLQYYGGNSYYYQLQRFLFEKYMRFRNMFRSDALLAAILIVSPLLIMLFVIWNTCFDSQSNERGEIDSDDKFEVEEFDLESDEEQNLLNQHRHQHNHKKQD